LDARTATAAIGWNANGPCFEKFISALGKESLLNYLRNPNDFMDDARFQEYRQKYPNQIMPPYGNKNIKDLGKIVDYLLTQ